MDEPVGSHDPQQPVAAIRPRTRVVRIPVVIVHFGNPPSSARRTCQMQAKRVSRNRRLHGGGWQVPAVPAWFSYPSFRIMPIMYIMHATALRWVEIRGLHFSADTIPSHRPGNDRAKSERAHHGYPADLEFALAITEGPRRHRIKNILASAWDGTSPWASPGLSIFALATCASMALVGSAAMNEQAKAEAAAVAEFQRVASDPDPLGGQRQLHERAQQKLIAKHCNGQRCIKIERFERVTMDGLSCRMILLNHRNDGSHSSTLPGFMTRADRAPAHLAHQPISTGDL